MPILTFEERDSILPIEERDRRWKKIREAMEKRGLECLIVWGCHGLFRNYSGSLRYLSNINSEGYIVFPLKGEPTLITFLGGGRPTAWIADTRTGNPKYSKVISERLRELQLEKARIGVLELSELFGETGFPHSTYVALVNNFPEARFEDATDILIEARMIKSPAEIKCLELACEIGEKVIQAIIDTAKPGVREYEVKAKMMDTLFREGSESATMILFRVHHPGEELVYNEGFWAPPNPRILEKGDTLWTEFDASVLGYKGQFNQPFSLGKPSQEWQNIFNVAVESFNSLLSLLRPGISVGELIAAHIYPTAKAGYKRSNPGIHGLGLAIEEPYGDWPASPNYQPQTARIIKPGMVLEFEPSVYTTDGKMGISLGCPVLVTDTGCRLLSKNWRPEVKII